MYLIFSKSQLEENWETFKSFKQLARLFNELFKVVLSFSVFVNCSKSFLTKLVITSRDFELVTVI